ncbi:MAG: cation:proton antiporter [Sarcina sp.]
MEQTLNYNSLLIISITAFITPFLVSKLKNFKIPYQVGEIVVGVIVGKTVLNIVRPDLTIYFLSNLGLAYLMFLSGLEVNFDDFTSNKADKSFIFISIKMIILSAVISLFLSFTLLRLTGVTKGVLLFSLIFIASSPGLVLPILKQKNMLKSEFGKTILTFSIMCEFVSLIGITVIFSISESGFSLKSFQFILIFIFAIVLYFLSKLFMKKNDFTIPSFKNIHVMVRAAFALILILVAIAAQLNTEIVLGSFLAGLIFSLLIGKAKEEVSHQLEIIGYGFLIPIFFIMVGANVDLKIVLSEPIILFKVAILLVIFFLVKLLPSIFLKKNFGTRNSLSATMLLTPQLSLVIVAAQLALGFGYLNTATYSAFILTTILSCIIFPIAFNKLALSLTDADEGNKDMIIREVVFSNPQFEGKPLKACKFPLSCRVFSITRNGQEFMPNANTKLLSGDLIILVGEASKVYQTLESLGNDAPL